MLTFKFTGADGKMIMPEILTSGMVGKQVRLEFSEEWAQMRKTAVFTAGGVTRDVVDPGEIVEIPAEVLARPMAWLHVGIYGVSDDGARVTPTIRAQGPMVRPGASPSKDPGVDPGLPVWAQIMEKIGDLQDLTTEAKENLVAAVNEAAKSGTTGGGSDSNSGQNVNPVAKTPDMTQPVGVDENGLLWVAPIGGGSGGDTTIHGIVWDLVNVTSSNNVVSVLDGTSLSAVLTAAEGYTLGDVTVTMGGEVLTGVWNADTATVIIASVTGDVVISCAGVEQTAVDTSPVIAEYDKAYQTATSSTLPTIQARTGMCYTKTYTYPSLYEKAVAAGMYNEETGGFADAADGTKPSAVFPSIKYFSTMTQYNANAETNGYPTTSIGRFNKIVCLVDTTVVSFASTSLDTVGVFVKHLDSGANVANANGVVFDLSKDDIESAYAYWENDENKTFPDGIRAGDIIFAGKNTEYYGMANIDGTLPGQTAAAEMSYDDDVAQNYAVATASILGEETANDTSGAYGISSNLAATIDEVRTAWMKEYGGDPRKIPLIITADQHGRTNSGIWNMLGKTLSLHDVSKICNLGDTCSVEWKDADSETPLLSCTQLENWCESIKKIPFSKRLDVFGNHDAWYYDGYSVEGNPIGTRYPSTMHHLDQYFRNIYARRNNNNGWFTIRDDYFNVKYVAITGFEFENGTSEQRISTAQMRHIIDEFGKDDGYDIVVVSHVPLYYQNSTNGWPIVTPDDVSDATVLRVAQIDTDALFTARKNKTSGTVTDSEGVAHSFDFSGCATDILCSLHGHTHNDSYNYTGGVGLLCETFDWFDENTVHFVLVDRVNRVLNVWKLEGDALTYQNYQVPMDKATE